MESRITRITFPTASFSLTRELIAWIEAEAQRKGVKKSVIVRDILNAAMKEQEGQAA